MNIDIYHNIASATKTGQTVRKLEIEHELYFYRLCERSEAIQRFFIVLLDRFACGSRRRSNH
jgi:hypothetical protein